MSDPLLSFVSAVYDKAEFLPETLASLRGQQGINPQSLEFVFADDASRDISLDWLRAEAARDTRIRVIPNETNAGPAIRINQAAALARGRYLLPVDADDLLPVNAATKLMQAARAAGAPLVFGRSRRGEDSEPIPETAQVETDADPLAFCAERQVVHMGFMCEAALWRAAGGADESIFIQDQSLPLRLSAQAKHLAYIDAVIYWLRPAVDGSLSRNVVQQHHDRFMSVQAMLTRADISDRARMALMRQAISALWKLHRDSGAALPHLSRAFIDYLCSRAFGRELTPREREAAVGRLALLPGVRRP